MKTIFATQINNRIYLYSFCKATNYASVLDTEKLSVFKISSTGKSITQQIEEYIKEYREGVDFEEECKKKSLLEKELKLTLRQIEQQGSHVAINKLEDNNYELLIYKYSKKSNGLEPDIDNAQILNKNTRLGSRVKSLLS